MAAPKKRHSKQRQNKRRTHDHTGIFSRELKKWASSDKEKKEFYKGHNLPGLSRCQRCNHLKRPHRVCGNCGHYRGEEMVDAE